MWMAIYLLVWLLAAGTAGILYVTGYFNEIALAAFGFLGSALIFGGVVAILPWWMDRLFSPPAAAHAVP